MVNTPPPLSRVTLDATRLTVTVRRTEDAPEIAQLVDLHDGDATVARGRDAAFAAITRALARGERLEIAPVVWAVSAKSDEAVALHAAVQHDPASRDEPSFMRSLQTPHSSGVDWSVRRTAGRERCMQRSPASTWVSFSARRTVECGVGTPPIARCAGHRRRARRHSAKINDHQRQQRASDQMVPIIGLGQRDAQIIDRAARELLTDELRARSDHRAPRTARLALRSEQATAPRAPNS